MEIRQAIPTWRRDAEPARERDTGVKLRQWKMVGAECMAGAVLDLAPSKDLLDQSSLVGNMDSTRHGNAQAGA